MCADVILALAGQPAGAVAVAHQLKQVPAERLGPVLDLINIFRGRVVDVSPKSILVQLTGPEDKIEAFIECCRPYGIKELARTGVIAMTRGAKDA